MRIASRKLNPKPRAQSFVEVIHLPGLALTIAGLSFATLHGFFRGAIVTSFAEARWLDCAPCRTSPRQARGGLQQQIHARIDTQCEQLQTNGMQLQALDGDWPRAIRDRTAIDKGLQQQTCNLCWNPVAPNPLRDRTAIDRAAAADLQSLLQPCGFKPPLLSKGAGGKV